MSNYLFATPSFLSGAARTLDIVGLFDFYNLSPTGEIANRRGLWSDWVSVGKYLRDSIEDLKTEIETPQETR